jgi:16S rRNA (uracil1498-N3)-methyltransferase
VTAPVYHLPAGELAGLVSLAEQGAAAGVPAGAGGAAESAVIGELTLTGPEGRHAALVRRTKVGEVVDLADGSGWLARGRVVGVGEGTLRVAVLRLDRFEPPNPRLGLVQALAKGGRDELAIEVATELGVDLVIPWQAERSVVVWSGPRGDRSRQRWEDTVTAAAKQSRRPSWPAVEPALNTRQLCARGAGGRLILLDEVAEMPLGDLDWPALAALPELLLVVGPEGGVSDGERAALLAAGAHAARLGPWVLRSSSAGAAALSLVNHLLGRWSADSVSAPAGLVS